MSFGSSSISEEMLVSIWSISVSQSSGCWKVKQRNTYNYSDN
jgi:hypothetical protein